jgi:hypothetical protein
LICGSVFAYSGCIQVVHNTVYVSLGCGAALALWRARLLSSARNFEKQLKTPYFQMKKKQQHGLVERLD